MVYHGQSATKENLNDKFEAQRRSEFYGFFNASVHSILSWNIQELI